METGLLKLCDFGSAKQLDPKGTNISYICSRYYRAPELIFDCTRYSTSIDIWAYGCVVAEMVMRNPFFRGESSADQLNKIMRVIGSPTTEEILSMNSKSIHTRIPKVNGFGIEAAMSIYFTPSNCVDLLKDVLKYNPFNRPTGMELIAHVFHKDVRKGIDFTQRELEEAKRRCVIITE
ncbi:Protein kinase domain-containing protein [Entamoeba marina]